MRSPLEGAGDAVVPSVSILLAVVLGIASILSIVAFINHAAHSMDVSQILRRVTDEVLSQAREAWPEPEPDSSGDTVEPGARPDPPDGAVTVRFAQYGWVQNVDYDRLLAVLPAGSRARLDTFAGQYAVRTRPSAASAPPPRTWRTSRTRCERPSWWGRPGRCSRTSPTGCASSPDVALKAMSPGINDPTTAHDAISHLGTVLADLLRRRPPAQLLTGRDGQELLVLHATTHDRLVGIAFDEVRIASADQPTVLIYLLEVLHQVERSLDGVHRPRAIGALRAQAELIRAMNEDADVPEPDRERVRVAHARHHRG